MFHFYKYIFEWSSLWNYLQSEFYGHITYFSNHIFHKVFVAWIVEMYVKNTYFTSHIEWTEHKFMILIPANKYQTICHCLNFKIFLSTIISIILIFLWSKSFVNIIFYRAENKKLQRQDNLLLKILFTMSYSGTRKVFCKIMQHMFFKVWFPLLFNMR